MIDRYINDGLVRTEKIVTGGELIFCPNCNEHSDLVMHTWKLDQGLAVERNGMFAEYFCRTCERTYILGLFNMPLGEDKITPAINWFRKETAAEKELREADDYYVAVVPHGSEGRKPLNYKNCPLFKKDGSKVSCVSGSGDSMCSGFMGHVSDDVIECAEGR